MLEIGERDLAEHHTAVPVPAMTRHEVNACSSAGSSFDMALLAGGSPGGAKTLTNATSLVGFGPGFPSDPTSRVSQLPSANASNHRQRRSAPTGRDDPGAGRGTGTLAV